MSCGARRPGPLLPTAHDVVREYRVLDLLTRAEQPVTRPAAGRASARTRTVLGAPFYLMERVEGVVIRDTLPGWLDGPARRALGTRSARPRSPRSTGWPSSRSSPPASAARAATWNGSCAAGPGSARGSRPRSPQPAGEARALPDYDAVRDWLVAHLPAEAEPAVVHGDCQAGQRGRRPGRDAGRRRGAGLGDGHRR